MRRTGLPTTWAAHGSCPDSGLWEYGIWISGPVSAYQYPAWKVASGKVPHVEASPVLRCCKFRILDLRIVPPPPAGPRGTKRSPKLLSSSRISRRQSINAHARGLSKESSGIRQNDKSGRNPGPYENCFQSGFLLLPSFPLVHPGNSGFRTLPSRQASRVQPEPRTLRKLFSVGLSPPSFLPPRRIFFFPLVHPGLSDFRTLPSLSAGIASSRCPDRKAGPSNQTWRI